MHKTPSALCIRTIRIFILQVLNIVTCTATSPSLKFFGFLPTDPTTELVQHVRARKHNASVRGWPVRGRQVGWATHMTMSTTLHWSWPPLARCRRPTVGPCSGCAPSDDRHSTTLRFRPTYRRRAHCSANLCTIARR